MRVGEEWVCLVCQENGIEKRFDGVAGFTSHLRHMVGKENHPKDKKFCKEYYDRFLKENEDEGICQNPNCPNGNPETSFQSITKGYSVGCCGSCSQKVPRTRERTIATNMKKYGTKSHNQSEEVKEKKKETWLENYGVDNPLKCNEIVTKMIETKRPFQKEIQKTRENTNYERYKVINIMKDPIIRDKMSETIINNSKSSVITRLDKLGFETLEYTKCIDNCLLKCKICGEEIVIKPSEILYNNRIYICNTCFPDRYGYMQNELFEFVYSLDNSIIKNDKSILDGKEIDILIPTRRIGIEFDGLYWHTESKGKDKNYHRDKTILAKSKNIDLIHIFEDEWIYKNEIVKSMIKYRLFNTEETIYGRNTKIEFIGYKDSVDFLNINHIQGAITSKINVGLLCNNELVSILVMNKPRFDHNYEWEILRFCNKLNTSVVGGFSKLLKFFIFNFNPNSIITYADARFGEGNVYLKNDFKKIRLSKPNYFYLGKSKKRESRLKYQKHKLENLLETFDSSMTEWENMKLNGYDRIWDCGNYVFELKL